MTDLYAICFICTHDLAHLVSEDQAVDVGRGVASQLYRWVGFGAMVDLIDSEEVADAVLIFLALDVLPSDEQIVGPLADEVRADLHRRTGLDFAVTAAYGPYDEMRGPVVSFVAPDSGDAAGGDVLSIEGARFLGITSVKFDGVDAASFSVIDSTAMTVTTPAHAAGAVDLDVTNDIGTATVTFTYV